MWRGNCVARLLPYRQSSLYSHGLPNAPDDEARLRQAFEAGRSPEGLAPVFGRTPKALRLRAQRLGLITEPKDWRECIKTDTGFFLAL